MRFIWVLAFLGTTAQAQEPLWPQVSALLTERCIICHSGSGAPLGLSLDSYDGLMNGSFMGSVVTPGDPAGSEIIRRLRGQSTPQMPLDGPPFLDDVQIALVERWIAAGAEQDGESIIAETAPDDGIITYRDVEPIFKQRCIVCHSDNGRYTAPPEGLRLTSLADMLAGGERVVLIPGNPQASEIWRRIEGLADPRMPFDGPPYLSDAEIALIRDWIANGAMDDDGAPSAIPTGYVRFRGLVTGENEIDGVPFRVTPNTRVEDRLTIGQQAEVRATINPDGSLMAYRLRAR